jgi:hypothetical protein
MDAETVVQAWYELQHERTHWRDAVALLRSEMATAPKSLDASAVLFILDNVERGTVRASAASAELHELLIKDADLADAFTDRFIEVMTNRKPFAT